MKTIKLSFLAMALGCTMWLNAAIVTVAPGDGAVKSAICFTGDDHSFEHAQKEGINYVRPGCGRDANYSQVTTLPDAAYTLMYRRVSCCRTAQGAAQRGSIDCLWEQGIFNTRYS